MTDRPYRVYRGGEDAEPDGDEPVLDLDVGPPQAAPDVLPEPPTVAPAPIVAAPEEVDAPVVLPPVAPPRRPAPPPFVLPRPGRRRGRRILLAAGLLAVGGTFAWIVLGYLAFADAVRQSHRRLQPEARPALSPTDGSPLNAATTILVIGADRTGHADSMQLVHTDPGAHLVSTIALPRDLRVVVAGHGEQKLNAAYFIGGPARTIATVQDLIGLPIHHVIVVDFRGFVTLIDALGGVDVVSARALRSRFDGYTYRFPRGAVHLDGRHALAYARVRKNDLDRTDSDVSRGVRQAQVIAALRARLARPGTLLHLRSVGARLADPLATDLTARQLLELGFVDFRARRHLACTLGGSPSDDPTLGNVLLSDADGNRRVLGEALGRLAVRRVRATEIFAPRCVERR